ncbi:MAG TPA: hypothetical protein VHY56_05285, partial [Candidatus Binataceae bacterium]|nr:hypothetical protein [Candidatus Binataceae bacterium]
MERGRKERRELRRALPADSKDRGTEVILGDRFGAVYAGAPFGHVQVEFEYALFAKNGLGEGHDRCLDAFSQDGAAGAQEEIPNQLLGDCGRAARFAASQILPEAGLDLIPVEAM